MKANDWESSDEAYWPDGEQVNPDSLQSAREIILDGRGTKADGLFEAIENEIERDLIGRPEPAALGDDEDF